MDILGALNSSSATAGTQANTSTAENALAQQDFMQLMLTQMQHQDPFQPMENGEFLAQLAQFSTVNGITEMQASLQSLADSLGGNDVLSAAGMIDRVALVETDRFSQADGDGVRGQLNLTESSTAVMVSIVDAQGQSVRDIELGGANSGRLSFEWDGDDNNGRRAADGEYQLTARYLSGDQWQALPTLLEGRVQSVHMPASGSSASAAVDGMGEVSMAQIRGLATQTN